MSTKKSLARPAGVSPAPPPSGPARAAKARLLVVDDHPLTREGLAGVISRQADMEVCGQAGDPAQALAALAKTNPDLMLLDLTMPGRSGLEFIKDLRAMKPEMLILVLSMHDERLYAERVLRAGARGYLMKDAGSDKLLEVIRQVLMGQYYFSPQVTLRLVDIMSGRRPLGAVAPVETLSDREFEVFCLLGRGQSTKEVAQTLHLSAKTVDVYRAHIKKKLQLKDAASLIHHAVRWVETQAAWS